MSERAVRMTAGLPALLSADEPAPFEVVNPDGAAPFLLLCDHASERVPAALEHLGLDEPVIRRHIGWDIGAAEVSRRLSHRFDAPLVLSGYSRLVIDCNRELDDPTSIPEISDGVIISGNRSLHPRAIEARQAQIFHPYHNAVRAALKRFADRGHAPGIISMHSFTPVFRGDERPWHIGVLWNKDPRIPKPFIANLQADSDIAVGDNEPYSGVDQYGYSISNHAEAHGFPHVLIEIRQDLIDTHHGAAAWSERIARTLGPALFDDLEIYEAKGF
ncbi:MAG: N-formylglutamate amidohydrolase [Alphaproteobacteria bacterium]|nr:N-formylglutamate amidohydrolase [Alphaproteobacteria bacterium]